MLNQFSESNNATDLTFLLALLMQCWSHVESDGLAMEFTQWLFGDNKDPELNGVTTHPLKHVLLQLCQSSDHEVTLEALSLFDVILERPCDPVRRFKYTSF